MSKAKMKYYLVFTIIAVGIVAAASLLLNSEPPNEAEIGNMFLQLIDEGDDAVLSIVDDNLKEPVGEMLVGKGVPRCLSDYVGHKQIVDRSDGVLVTCDYLTGRTQLTSKLMISVENGLVTSIKEF